MPPSRLTSLLAALAALLLTACAAEEEPTPIFAEPTATPTPSAEAAPKDPHRSPKALIRHWNKLSNTMQAGDTTAWRELTEECSSCAAAADRIDEIYAAGGYVDTEGTTIIGIKRDTEFTSGVYLVDVDVSPTEYRERRDAELATFPGELTTYRVYLTDGEEGWAFHDFAKLAQ